MNHRLELGIPPELASEVAPAAEQYRASGVWRGPRFGKAFSLRAAEFGDRTAVVDRGGARRITYLELETLAERMACFLSDGGVGRGRVIIMQLPNVLESAVVAIAASQLGAVVSPVLPNYRADEIHYMLDLTEAAMIITPHHYRGNDFVAMIGEVADRSRHRFSHAAIDLDLPGIEWMTQNLPNAGKAPAADDDASGVAVILFTSGTTSRPKAVMQTDEALNANLAAFWHMVGLGTSEIAWMPSPVGHSTGFNWGIRAPLMHGATLVLQDKWDPESALDLIKQEKPTYTLAATVFLHDLLTAAASHPGSDLSSLKAFGCGGAAVPAELVREARSFGCTVLRLYGLSETEIATTTRPVDDADKLAETDGTALPSTRIEIRDDHGTPLPPGSVGEVFVAGPGMSVGYYKDPDRTREMFRAGWVGSGDLGRVDVDGYLTIVGRKSETIIRGGTNISPRELEEKILQMPGVVDVTVIGLPDERMGETVCACIISAGTSAPTVESVRDALLAMGTATYKLPQRVIAVESFPATSSGKVQRGVLRDLVLANEASINDV